MSFTKDTPIADKKYICSTSPIENGPGVWNSLKVYVYTAEEFVKVNGVRVTTYTRNYASMFATFCPFTRDGKDYAFYSKDYTATSLMELPSGKEIWTEAHDTFGFCPVEYLIPDEGVFGFMSGCIWGDESHRKLKCVDLRDLENGNITIFEPFGYCPLATESIQESIEWFDYEEQEDTIYADINTMQNYEYKFTVVEVEPVAVGN